MTWEDDDRDWQPEDYEPGGKYAPRAFLYHPGQQKWHFGQHHWMIEDALKKQGVHSFENYWRGRYWPKSGTSEMYEPRDFFTKLPMEQITDFLGRTHAAARAQEDSGGSAAPEASTSPVLHRFAAEKAAGELADMLAPQAQEPSVKPEVDLSFWQNRVPWIWRYGWDRPRFGHPGAHHHDIEGKDSDDASLAYRSQPSPMWHGYVDQRTGDVKVFGRTGLEGKRIQKEVGDHFNHEYVPHGLNTGAAIPTPEAVEFMEGLNG